MIDHYKALPMIYELPKPTKEALARSLALSNVIRQHIAAASAQISFADYMAQALYHPEWGYYSQADLKIGREGDFITAPEMTPLFAACVARLALQVFEQTGTTNILELGAGSGQFAKDILLELKKQGIHARYFIYEISPGLRKKQQALLHDLASQVEWLDTLPTNFAGFIFGNEVLDALPVTRIQRTNNNIVSCCVNSDLQYKTSPDYPAWADDIAGRYDFSEGYTTEIHTQLPDFIAEVAACLDKGVILFADYGYGEAEYYHPQRNQGTLTCFYRHHKHQDPFLYPGLQDITAHVDFTRVIDLAADSGCDLLGYTTLAAFLLDTGLLDRTKQELMQLSMAEQVQMRHAVKVLTLPTEMGDIIKVMALSKRSSFKPIGFNLLDRRRDL